MSSPNRRLHPVIFVFLRRSPGPESGIGTGRATHDIDITSRACASPRRGAPNDTPETAIDPTESLDHD
jgi:hypothetical protein